MNTGKCPNCGVTVDTVKTEPITADAIANAPRYEGVSCLCPSCGIVLGVNLVPVTLQQEALEKAAS